jgi:hypothetical protein
MFSPGRSVTEGAFAEDQPETLGVVPVVNVSGDTRAGLDGATGSTRDGAAGKGWARATCRSRWRAGAADAGGASSERCTETGAEAMRALELE